MRTINPVSSFGAKIKSATRDERTARVAVDCAVVSTFVVTTYLCMKALDTASFAIKVASLPG